MLYFSAMNQLSLYAQSMNMNRFMASANGQRVTSGQRTIPAQGEIPGQTAVQGQKFVQQQTALQGQKPVQVQTALPGQKAEKLEEEIFFGSRRVSKKGDFDTYECQTCKNRKYQDGSNDPGVSFKTPTTISPERAAFAIRSHEAEHVAHARLKALEEDKEIVSQSVSYRTGICPECRKTFMAGGNTRTVLRTAPETYQQEPVKKGVYLDLTA